MADDNKKIIEKMWDAVDIETKEMSIISDERQYSIRIPKNFVDTIKTAYGSLEKLKFKFTLKNPPVGSREKPELKGELVHG